MQRDGWLGGDSTSGRNRPREEAAKEGRKELINLPSSFLACMTSSLLLSPCYIPPTAIVNELMRAEGEREREWREVFVEAALKKIVVLLLSGGED